MAMTTATTTAPLTAAVSSCLQSENGDRDNEDENEDAEEDEDADNNTHIRMVGPHPPFSMGRVFFCLHFNYVILYCPCFVWARGFFCSLCFRLILLPPFPIALSARGLVFYMYIRTPSHILHEGGFLIYVFLNNIQILLI